MMENPSEAFRSMFIAAHKYLFSVFEEKLKAEGSCCGYAGLFSQ